MSQLLQHLPFPDGRPGSAAVTDGHTVYLAQLTAPPQIGPTDIRTQAQQLFALLEQLLGQAGSRPQNLLQLTFTVADSRCIPVVRQVFEAWSTHPTPAVIWRFGRLPGALVAVDGIAAAALPDPN